MTPNKEHITKLIDFLFDEVLSAGGDGDAIWYTRFFELKDIIPIIEEYNDVHNTGWEIIKNSPETITWGINQEWIIITTDEETFDDMPNWSQVTIKF